MGAPEGEKHILSSEHSIDVTQCTHYTLQPPLPWTSTQTYEIFKPLLSGFPFFKEFPCSQSFIISEGLHFKRNFDGSLLYK